MNLLAERSSALLDRNIICEDVMSDLDLRRCADKCHSAMAQFAMIALNRKERPTTEWFVS